MKSFCAMVEIPVTDFNRAKRFYTSILGLEIREMNVLDTQIGMFPTDGYSNWGFISKDDRHSPSKNGSLIYINAEGKIEETLKKIKAAGGEIAAPKSKISDEAGYYAIFIDTEGNRIELHSMK